MLQFLSKFMYVLKGKQKALVFMLGLFILTSFLEVIGIGAVGPFVALATNPGAIQQNPWLQLVYSRLNLSSEYQFLIIVGLTVIVIFYVKSYLSFTAQKRIFEFGYGQQGEISCRLMNAYMQAPYTFHLGRNSAVLIQSITAETGRFANGVMMPLLTSISNSIVVLAIVALLIKTSLLAVIIIAGILPVIFFLFNALKGRMKQWGEDVSESNTEMIRVINHGLGGLKETKVIGCESYFEEQLQEQAKKYSSSISAAISFSNLPRFAIEAFLVTFLVLFTFLSITSNRNSQNLTSVLGIFALASIRLLPATGNLVTSITGMKYNLYSLDKIYLDLKELEVMEALKPVHTDRYQPTQEGSSKLVFPFTRQITLDNVIYSYPNASKNALEGISVEIKKGQSIGLVGKSGAGKTTLVDLILGLLSPQSGDIRVDGISIYTDLRCWQNMIGYVPQSIFLTDDTLEGNIAFGTPAYLIDQQRLNEAVKAAQLSELVQELPAGLQTMVGERGVLLSGGQRQRIGIARALYHEREILVFDEATAALDNETESLVTESIKSLSGTKTMIIIAHRLSTIEHCDRVYMLEKGRVAKSGNYQEVVSSK